MRGGRSVVKGESGQNGQSSGAGSRRNDLGGEGDASGRTGVEVDQPGGAYGVFRESNEALACG